MAVPCPYPTPFGIVPHAGMNGELTSPGAAYAGLHNISPQMSAAAAAAAAAAAYGRSPVVSVCCVHLVLRAVYIKYKTCGVNSSSLTLWFGEYAVENVN